MRLYVKIILLVLRWILIFGLLLFSITTWMGRSYLQTIFIWISVFSLAYWPPFIRKKLNNRISIIALITSVIV